METDTVRTVEGETPEAKAARILGAHLRDGDGLGGRILPDTKTETDADAKARVKREQAAEMKRRKAEEAERKAELKESIAMLTPLIYMAGSQAINRMTPELPYTMEEAEQLTQAAVEVADKHGDGLLFEYKEELALAFAVVVQAAPRYLMWKSKQPVDLSSLPKP